MNNIETIYKPRKPQTPQLVSPTKPIIIGKQKYLSVWFDNVLRKEVGFKPRAVKLTETGRKFKCVQTGFLGPYELVDTSKFKNKKFYINYPVIKQLLPDNKALVEVWILVE